MTHLRVQAPGRINIIGEHTDYNGGFVLPAAINKQVSFYLEPNGTDNLVQITSKQYKEHYTFDLNAFEPIESGWQNYVMGVVSELQKLSPSIKGFSGVFEGNIPIGSGMSSSAALECSLAYGLNELFDLGLDAWQLIKAAQMAEHIFVGTKCGIMDQFASIMGRENNAMLLDCRSLEYKHYPLDLDDYQFLLFNTNISHSLADSAYNTRRQECEEGVAFLKKYYSKIDSLRDLTLEQLIGVQANMDEVVFRRCQHVVSENKRVLLATKALEKAKMHKLGELMYQSHFSLQHDYEVSCPELDFLVQQTIEKADVMGSRMMGGGFGGCTINLVKKQRVSSIIDQISKAYQNQFGLSLTPIEIVISKGATIIH